jgi:carboxyl-terminal processing protease
MSLIARRIILALVTALVGSAASAESGDALAPEDRHRASAQIIVELLSNHHYRERSLDDELSRAALDAYLDALDPERFYFQASDIADFERYREELDDQLRQGRLDAAWSIFQTYRERVQERSDYVQQLLESDFDKPEDAVYRLDREGMDWPRSTSSMNELWRKRIANDLLSLRLAGDSDDDTDTPAQTLSERYAQLARNVSQYEADDVFEIYMNAWSRLFDPHTSYLSPRTRENFDINMSLSLQGIGAMLTTQGQYTEVTELVAGGPADKDGELGVGDRIIAVGQEGEDMESVVGWRLGDVVQLIRGPKDSVVRLEILPANSGRRRMIDITRNEIVLDDRAAKSRILTVENGETSRRIGIIELPSFYHDFSPEEGQEGRSTTTDVARLIEAMSSGDGIDGLVIDLRGNAGGSLQEATKLTGLFIEDGPVVQVRYSNGERNILRDNDRGRLAYDGPLSVLVNGRSASASEIFAGAVQDYGRGLVLGEQTFGKGTVQDLVDLNRYQFAADGEAGSVKFTRAKYYRITGASTQKRGIKPDVAMDTLLRDPGDITERAEDYALPWDEIEAVEFERLGNPARLAETLAERHQQRIDDRQGLQALQRERELMAAQREREEVSLNEAERRERQNERQVQRLNAMNARLRAAGQEPVDSLDAIDEDNLPDLVAREAARITADFLTLDQEGALTPIGKMTTRAGD